MRPSTAGFLNPISGNDQAMASTYSSSSSNSVPQFAIITISEISQLNTCNGAQIKVYLALAAHAGPDGDCWPGRRRLAEITGQRKENVSRATAALEIAGLIEKSQTPAGRVIYHLPLHHRPAAPVPMPEQVPPGINADTPPVSTPTPIEQTREQTKNQREAEPEPTVEPAPLSQEVLRTVKTTAPDTVPQSWIEQGRALRPDLDEVTIRNSAAIFQDTSRANGRQLVDWQAGFTAWLRRERAPKGPPTAHTPRSAPTPYAGPVSSTVAPETAQEAKARFAAQMERYGAVPGEGGMWTPPRVSATTSTPSTPSTPAAGPRPAPRPRLTADQARQLAELAAAGITPKEAAASLGAGA